MPNPPYALFSVNSRLDDARIQEDILTTAIEPNIMAIAKGNGASRQRPEGTLQPLGAVSVIVFSAISPKGYRDPYN